MTHTTPMAAPVAPALQAIAHVEAMSSMLSMARLADALNAADHKLCWAIKNSRDCGLPELEQGLLSVQAQFDALVARLQPALLFKPEQAV